MALTFDRGGRSDGSSIQGVPTPVPPDLRQSGLVYEPFYGLKEKPFSLTSDSRFFYQSRSHAPAFDDLFNAIRRRESLNVLTGDIGTGKTTLCRAVLQSLDRKTFSAFVPDPFASREELLKVLLTDFGVVSTDDMTSGRLRNATRTELSCLLSDFLGTLAPLQAFAVVVIDEAQNLSQQLLEEVRILSDADGQLQVVLVGQLELRERLKLPDMRQLDQRVSVHCQLQPLDLAGVAGYISHRLHVAGGTSDRVRFTGEAVEAIYLLSGGVPRLINRLCDRALRYGHSKKEGTIDADIVESANPGLERMETAAVALPAAEALFLSEAEASPDKPPAGPSAAATAPNGSPAAPPAPSAAEAQRVVAPVAARPEPLPAHLETWLQEIEREPEVPPVDLDWRQRWAATDAVADPLAGRRSGVRLRIPASSNPRHYTHVDRVRRRLTHRFFTTAVALILLLGAIMVTPAAVGASLDMWSQIDEMLTPPPMPDPLPPPARPAVLLPRVMPAADPLDAVPSAAADTSSTR